MAKRRSHGDGSIFQTAAGTWRGYVSLPLGKRKYVTGTTRAEVQQKLRQLQKEAEAGRDLGSPDQTLATWLATWLETVKRQRSTRTHEIYSDTCRLYIVPAMGHIKLAALKADYAQAMLYDMVDRGLSAKTASLTKGVLSAALSLAVKRGLVARNVATLCDLPKDDTPFVGKAMTPEDVQLFLKALDGHTLDILFRVLLLTGMRVGEACSLRWADMDATKRILTIKVSKTGQRSIALSDDILRLLKQQRIAVTSARLKATNWTDNDLIFPNRNGNPYTAVSLAPFFKSILAHAGLGDFRLHDLRHTCISLLMANGVPVKTIMTLVGHKRLDTTLNIYAHSSPDDQRAAIEGLEKSMKTG